MTARPGAWALLIVAVLTACSSSSGSSSGASPDRRAPATSTSTLATGSAAASRSGSPSEPLVAMLGDSNTYLSIPQLEAAFGARGLASTIRGISGSGLKDLERDWLPAALAIAAAPPAVVVLALGTNDAAIPSEVDAFGGRLDTLLGLLGDVPVVAVTHVEGGSRPARAARAVNDAIRAAPTRHPNVTVLDLAPELADHRQLLGHDDLHYSTLGRAWFAEQVASAACHAASASRCS